MSVQSSPQCAPIDSPTVAVVLVNYRTPQLTVDCAHSLLELSYPNLKIYVVENASGDDSLAILRERLPVGCELIESPHNGGYTAGNNVGIRAALAQGAQYLLILNPDTVSINRQWLSKLVDFLDTNPSVGAVGPRVHLYSIGNIQNTVLRFPWLWRRFGEFCSYRLGFRRKSSETLPMRVEVLNGVCVLMRARCLEDIGLFDERTFAYIEDHEWCYRAAARGWLRAYFPIDSVLHLQKKTGYELGGFVDFLLKRNTLYFLLKTKHLFQAAGFTILTLLLAAIRLVIDVLRGRKTASLRWITQLANSYLGLWTCRWNSVMGKPSI